VSDTLIGNNFWNIFSNVVVLMNYLLQVPTLPPCGSASLKEDAGFLR
jgi:hypothetical protein